MLDVARETVDGDAENNIDPLAPHMRQELLDAGTRREVHAADCRVEIGPDQCPASLLNKCLAEFDLCLDRDLILAVRRIARIKQYFGHEIAPPEAIGADPSRSVVNSF